MHHDDFDTSKDSPSMIVAENGNVVVQTVAP